MRLGDLIKRLEPLNAEDDVRFDFCGTVPRGIQSYRGYYEQLAIGWCDYDSEEYKGSPKLKTVGALRDALKACIGKTFSGWKGGDYVMDAHTAVWVDNAGEATGTAIVGVFDCGYGYIYLETRREEAQ